MAPKKSQIWTHYSEETEGKVKCLYCRVLSVKNKSTSTLIRHMSHKHPTQPINGQTIPDFEVFEDEDEYQQELRQIRLQLTSFNRSSFSRLYKSQPITQFLQKPLSISKKKRNKK